jgi:hypothetical protein
MHISLLYNICCKIMEEAVDLSYDRLLMNEWYAHRHNVYRFLSITRTFSVYEVFRRQSDKFTWRIIS